jgi:acyl-CoA synthetase (AMP-forming)/AMP-acid ligase II
LVGRKKDIIISGGENIYPLEIEQRLMEHPCILEAVVVGQEHKRLQEVPVAFLVKKNGTDVTIPELKAFCTQYLSGYKIPRFMIFLANIPKLGTSKIDRHKLTHMLKHIKQ